MIGFVSGAKVHCNAYIRFNNLKVIEQFFVNSLPIQRRHFFGNAIKKQLYLALFLIRLLNFFLLAFFCIKNCFCFYYGIMRALTRSLHTHFVYT